DEEGRNPFEPKIQLDRQQREQSKDEKKKETIENPLERYTLKQLRLAGIISGVPVPKGLFIDPEGVGHLVKEGDRIGKEGGKVDDVRPDEVVVRIPAGETDEKVRTRTVELAKSELPTKRRQGLTEKQREMLKKLRRSRQGRRALKESYEDISGRGAGRPRRRRRGTSPRRRQPTGDQRFPGLAPPEQEQQQ
ncbi:MAG: pilus assembly protein PilP, partial [Bradymonadaceae bacterium]